jgi:hypothetical protein
MKWVKRFSQIFESITNIVNSDWTIIFNHGVNHNLDDKLKNRVGVDEKMFELFLNDVLRTCLKDNITGDWIFISIKMGIKLVTNVNYLGRKIYIVTILGKKEQTKPQKNIKLI